MAAMKLNGSRTNFGRPSHVSIGAASKITNNGIATKNSVPAGINARILDFALYFFGTRLHDFSFKRSPPTLPEGF